MQSMTQCRPRSKSYLLVFESFDPVANGSVVQDVIVSTKYPMVRLDNPDEICESLHLDLKTLLRPSPYVQGSSVLPTSKSG